MNTKQQLIEIVQSGLTQDEVAARTGVSQPTISRILRGKHQDMKMSTAQSISDLYEKTCISSSVEAVA